MKRNLHKVEIKNEYEFVKTRNKHTDFCNAK